MSSDAQKYIVGWALRIIRIKSDCLDNAHQLISTVKPFILIAVRTSARHFEYIEIISPKGRRGASPKGYRCAYVTEGRREGREANPCILKLGC